MTQPSGTYLEPLNAVSMVLGLGGSFIASTADWMPDHLASTLQAAFDHPGFAYVHISQRCPHFDPNNFDHKTTSWFSFLKHDKGIPPDKRLAEKAEVIDHDPSNITEAFKLAIDPKRYFGLFYCNPDKPRYDQIMINQVKTAEQKPRSKILDRYKID